VTPESKARVCADALWAEDNVARSLGMEIVEIGPGRAVLAMIVQPSMTNGHGTCHGGYIFILADAAFAFACNSHGPRNVAQNAQVHFLAPGRLGARLTAEAIERRRGERSGLTDVTVRDDEGLVIAEFRGASRMISGSLLPSAAG
jgi:acyl-CoA thioesterase